MQVINFEKTNGTYTLRDSIVLQDDEVLTEEEIETIKQQRFDNWLAVITAPPPENTAPFELPPDEEVFIDPPFTDEPIV